MNLTPKTPHKKNKKSELLIAVLLLLFGAYGVREVMRPEKWVETATTPELAKLENPALEFNLKTTSEENSENFTDPEPSLASSMPDETKAFLPPVSTTISDPVRKPSGFPFVMDDSKAPAANRYGTISIIPKFIYSRINSVDSVSGATASFVSTLNSGIDFSWAQHWSDFFETNFHAGFLKESYLTDTSLKTIQNADHTLSNIGFGMTYTNLASFTLGFDMKQRDFINAPNATTLTFDALAVPQFSLAASLPILALDPFTLSLQADFAYLLPAQNAIYSVAHGTAYGGGVMLNEVFNPHFNLSGRFWYGQANQNTSLETQVYKEIGMSFGLTYRFLGKKDETP